MRELGPLNPAGLMSGRDAQRGAVTTLGATHDARGHAAERCTVGRHGPFASPCAERDVLLLPSERSSTSSTMSNHTFCVMHHKGKCLASRVDALRYFRKVLHQKLEWCETYKSECLEEKRNGPATTPTQKPASRARARAQARG